MSDTATGTVTPEASTTDGASTNTETKAVGQGDSGNKAQSAKERLKYTIDGEDVEEEVDWSDRESLKKRFQLGYAAEKRMAQAKSEKSKAIDIVKAFETDPISVLKRLPDGKGKELAEKFLLDQIQEETMTPQEKELRDLKRFKEQREKDDAEAKKKADQERQDKMSSEFAQKFQTTIIEALEKSGLPKSPALVKMAAGLMKKKLDIGIELDASDLVGLIKNNTMETLRAVAKDADGDQLISMFGDDIANKIRKADLKKLQDKNSAFSGQTAKQDAGGKTNHDQKPMSMREWKESLNKRFT